VDGTVEDGTVEAGTVVSTDESTGSGSSAVGGDVVGGASSGAVGSIAALAPAGRAASSAMSASATTSTRRVAVVPGRFASFSVAGIRGAYPPPAFLNRCAQGRPMAAVRRHCAPKWARRRSLWESDRHAFAPPFADVRPVAPCRRGGERLAARMLGDE